MAINLLLFPKFSFYKITNFYYLALGMVLLRFGIINQIRFYLVLKLEIR